MADLNALKKEARTKTTSELRLRELAGLHTDLSRAVAQNKHTPPELLEELSRSPDLRTRMGVARHPSTPRSTLERLAEGAPQDLLKALGANPNCPENVLERVAASPVTGTRFDLAWRVPLPPRILERLARDPVDVVRGAIIQRHSAALSPAQIEALVADTATRFWAAGHLLLTDAQLERVLSDPRAHVRAQLRQNPSVQTPERLARLEREGVTA